MYNFGVISDTPLTYLDLFDKLVVFERSLTIVEPIPSIIATANTTQRQLALNFFLTSSDLSNRNTRFQPFSSQRPNRFTKSQPSSNPARLAQFCNFCNIPSHETRDCWKLVKFLKDNQVMLTNNPSNPVANLVTSAPGNSMWMMDSGASHHVSSCPATLASLPFGPNSFVATKPLKFIYSDVWGPIQQSIDGFTYYVVFIDYNSEYVWFYPLKRKSDVSTIFPQYKLLVEKFFQTPIISIFIDNSG
ncbi:hypothetical protein OSB04_010561 [Centaurea solstitialis]|uniref:Integrase catalytic domain-containing protein n=1 Tax=Centaurea solstitialis TaxID=347529 RepID=A0AA38WCY5_9ASTR|nr:hypothetical protein OSB04_010561 [Centaurea solstitialis]